MLNLSLASENDSRHRCFFLNLGAPILAFEVARPGIIQVSEGPLNDTLGHLQRPGIVRFPNRLEVLLQRVRTGFLLAFAFFELRVLLVPFRQAPVVDKAARAGRPSQIDLPLQALGSSGSGAL